MHGTLSDTPFQTPYSFTSVGRCSLSTESALAVEFPTSSISISPFSFLENPLLILPEDSTSLLDMAKELHKKVGEIFERVKVGCPFWKPSMIILLMVLVVLKQSNEEALSSTGNRSFNFFSAMQEKVVM